MQIFKGLNCQFDYSKKSYILSIINLTPDSFSDGNRYQNIDEALKTSLKMVEQGADILDIGGESTRPNAKTIPIAQEIERVVPLIKAIREVSSIPISIDTRKSEVAQAGIDAGANIINDVSGLKYDSNMAKVIAKNKCGCILMHMRGEPHNMQQFTKYDNLIEDIISELNESIKIAKAHQIDDKKIMLDPGIGFSKTTDQNLHIINHIEKLNSLSYPILLGSSRKSFIGEVLDKSNPKDRLWGTAASIAVSQTKGVRFFRIHDTAEMSDVIQTTQAIINQD